MHKNIDFSATLLNCMTKYKKCDILKAEQRMQRKWKASNGMLLSSHNAENDFA